MKIIAVKAYFMYLRGVNIMKIERKFLVKNINELDLSKYNLKL